MILVKFCEYRKETGDILGWYCIDEPHYLDFWENKNKGRLTLKVTDEQFENRDLYHQVMKEKLVLDSPISDNGK